MCFQLSKKHQALHMFKIGVSKALKELTVTGQGSESGKQLRVSIREIHATIKTTNNR